MGSAIGDFAKRAAPAANAAAAVADVLGAGFKIAKEWNEAGRDMRPINFGKAADDFRAYDDRVTRFAVSVGANAETLRTKFERSVRKSVSCRPNLPRLPPTCPHDRHGRKRRDARSCRRSERLESLALKRWPRSAR